MSIASLPTPAARTSVPDVKHGDVLTARPAEAIVEALRARGFELVQSTANATHWQIRKRCYGCDSAAVGLRDRRPEGGEVQRACERHMDHTLDETLEQYLADGAGPTEVCS